MGTKKIALKRSHTEKAKLTRARPRFSFGFSRLAITFSRVTSQSHNLVIDLASFHQVEGGTETSLKLSTVGNFDTTRNQEKKRKRGKEEKRKRGKEEKKKRGKEEKKKTDYSPLGFLFWLDFWLDEIDGFWLSLDLAGFVDGCCCYCCCRSSCSSQCRMIGGRQLGRHHQSHHVGVGRFGIGLDQDGHHENHHRLHTGSIRINLDAPAMQTQSISFDKFRSRVTDRCATHPQLGWSILIIKLLISSVGRRSVSFVFIWIAFFFF